MTVDLSLPTNATPVATVLSQIRENVASKKAFFTAAKAGGTSNLTITVEGITAYATGQVFTFIVAGNFNSGSLTLNVNSIGAKTILLPSSFMALKGQENSYSDFAMTVIYDGTYFLVASMLPCSGINAQTGWLEIADPFSYSSSTVVNISGGSGTSRFGKGYKVRFKQGGGYKYFYIESVASATLTLNGGSDYSVANSAITDVAISMMEKPLDFPEWFNYTATPTGFSANPTNIVSKFKLSGTTCFLAVNHGTAGTSNATTYTVPLPFTAKTVTNQEWVGSCILGVDNGTNLDDASARISSGATSMSYYKDSKFSGWTNTGSKKLQTVNIWYEIA